MGRHRVCANFVWVLNLSLICNYVKYMYNIKARCVVGLICTYITLNSLLYISQNQHLHGKKNTIPILNWCERQIARISGVSSKLHLVQLVLPSQKRTYLPIRKNICAIEDVARCSDGEKWIFLRVYTCNQT